PVGLDSIPHPGLAAAPRKPPMRDSARRKGSRDLIAAAGYGREEPVVVGMRRGDAALVFVAQGLTRIGNPLSGITIVYTAAARAAPGGQPRPAPVRSSGSYSSSTSWYSAVSASLYRYGSVAGPGLLPSRVRRRTARLSHSRNSASCSSGAEKGPPARPRAGEQGEHGEGGLQAVGTAPPARDGGEHAETDD